MSVPLDCGPHPSAPISWCPTCGVERYPRFGNDDADTAAKVRRRCSTAGCRGHLVSLKLHPMPPMPRPKSFTERVSRWEVVALTTTGAVVSGAVVALVRWLF